MLCKWASVPEATTAGAPAIQASTVYVAALGPGLTIQSLRGPPNLFSRDAAQSSVPELTGPGAAEVEASGPTNMPPAANKREQTIVVLARMNPRRRSLPRARADMPLGKIAHDK